MVFKLISVNINFFMSQSYSKSFYHLPAVQYLRLYWKFSNYFPILGYF